MSVGRPLDEIEVTSRSVVVRRAHCAQHEIELVEPPAVWVATEVGVAIGDHLGDLRVGESLRRQTRPERPQRRRRSRPTKSCPRRSRNSTRLGLMPTVATRERDAEPKLTTAVLSGTTEQPAGCDRRTRSATYVGTSRQASTGTSSPGRVDRGHSPLHRATSEAGRDLAQLVAHLALTSVG